MSVTSYAIKRGYVEREEPAYFLDASPHLHQPDVYEWAYLKARDLDVTSLVDVGCGRAGKLACIYPRTNRWKMVGLDYGANIEWCVRNWPWGEWIRVDLDEPHEIEAEGALVICADVVEHLLHPEHALSAIHDSGCVAAVFSTPERDLAHGSDHNGPPVNPFHVREWNQTEFKKLLKGAGFKVKHSGLTASSSAEPEEKTILVLAEP